MKADRWLFIIAMCVLVLTFYKVYDSYTLRGRCMQVGQQMHMQVVYADNQCRVAP